MKRIRAWSGLVAAAGVVLIGTSGCQTWVPEAGLTLPSANYLKHQPQYIPPSPPFPLPRELANLEEAALQAAPAAPRPAGAVGP